MSSAGTLATHIGIVGGGASAVCLIDGLAQRGNRGGGVTIFDPGPHLWRGRPYQDDVESVRVNIPPGGMSVRFSDSGHFGTWLKGRSGVEPFFDHWCEAPFIPRSVYGRYLSETAEQALGRLRALGWSTEIVRERVEQASTTQRGLVLRTETGRLFPVDRTVLCVGAGRPADPYLLAGADGFVPEPYPVRRTLATIDPRADVGVIGTGLTAMDVVLGLVDRGHRGRIHLVSRGGALPAVRQRLVPYELRHFTAARFRPAALRGDTMPLPQIVAAMAEELAGAGADVPALKAELAGVTDEPAEHRLRRQLDQVDDDDLGLRILQGAVPATGPDVWPLLSPRDQASLFRHWYRATMSLCCPMPPTSARKIAALLVSGQLTITARLRQVTPRLGGGFTVDTDAGPGHVQNVVNAVNPPAHRVPAAAEPLVSSLVHAGLTRRHPRGGVTIARADSALISASGVESRVHVLGELASGSLFFTFGMPSLVDRAADIVECALRTPSDRTADPSSPLPRAHDPCATVATR